MTVRTLRAIDLCCGAGGWAAAARGLPIEFVAVADLAGDCLETWRVNHAADHPRCRRLEVDLSTTAGRDAVIDAAGDVDLVVGGIPCEQVSVLRGPNKCSEADLESWWKLIDNCLQIVRRTGARWSAIEDVIQIEKHLPGPLFLGWNVPHVRLDAAGFGPQSRVRTFVGRFPVPAPPGNSECLADCLRPGPHLTIHAAEGYEVNPHNNNRVENRFVRELDPAAKCPTITAALHIRGGRNKRTWIVVDEQGRRRQLSWQEAARVQGFPDDYLFVGGVTRACEMLGRAIPIQVGRAILGEIARAARGVH